MSTFVSFLLLLGIHTALYDKIMRVILTIKHAQAVRISGLKKEGGGGGEVNCLCKIFENFESLMKVISRIKDTKQDQPKSNLFLT